MAPDKRKRGRPATTNASGPDETAPETAQLGGQNEDLNINVDEVARPRNRGRPAAQALPLAPPATNNMPGTTEAEATQTRPGRRARPAVPSSSDPRDDAVVVTAKEKEPSLPIRPRNGRREAVSGQKASKQEASAQDSGAHTQEPAAQRGKSRKATQRKPLGPAPEEQTQPEPEPEPAAEDDASEQRSRRGRKNKDTHAQGETGLSERQSRRVKNKKDDRQREDATDGDKEPSQQPARRRRQQQDITASERQTQSQPEAEREASEASEERPRRRKKMAEKGDHVNNVGATRAKKTVGRRPSLQGSRDTGGGAQKEQPEQPRTKAKKRKQPVEEAQVEEARKRPKKQSQVAASSGQAKASQAQSRPSDAAAAPDEPPPASPPRPYRHLAPRVRQILFSKIESEWAPLAPSSIVHITNILNAAELPIVERLAQTGNQRVHAANGIRVMTRNMAARLRMGMPFPPAAPVPAGFKPRGRRRKTGNPDDDGYDSGRAAELDLASVNKSVRELEPKLDRMIHSVALLKKEKAALEKDVAEQYRLLEKIKDNARDDMRVMRDSLRKAHRLAPHAHPRDEEELRKEQVLIAHDAVGGLFQDVQADDDIRDLAGQLSNHVESMRTNAHQIEGVIPEIRKSSAALRQVLLTHLGGKHYEQALFGRWL